MRFALLLLAIVGLAGCGFLLPPAWTAGDDPRGKQLKAEAETLIFAVQRYESDNRRLPKSLSDLVPNYVQTLRPALKVEYDVPNETIGFSYQPSWPDTGIMQCKSKIRELKWECFGYI